MNIKRILGILFSTLAFCILPALAQVPSLLEYDGYLLESGKAVTGNRTIGVRLYNASTNGTLLYKETVGTVRVTNGEFYFQYGQNGTAGNATTPTAIASTLTGSQNWLALTINGTEKTPRERLLSVPFALRSADAQKTDADLRQVVQAFGQVIATFGGNSTNLLSNPAGTVSTIQKAVADLMEVRKRAEVVSVTSNITAEPNRSYFISGTSPSVITLPANPKAGDSVRVLGEGGQVIAPNGSMIISDWTPLSISLVGIGDLVPSESSLGSKLVCSTNLDVIYSIVKSPANPTNSYLVRSMNSGKNWSSLVTYKDSYGQGLLSCSSDGSKFLYESMSPNGTILRLGLAFGNQTKTLVLPNNSRYSGRALISKAGSRIFAFAGDGATTQKLLITENDGTTWRTSNLTIGNMTYSVQESMMYNPLAVSENGSIIAIKTTNQSHENELIVSENAGTNWRKANLPISGIQLSQPVMSLDGKNIVLFFNTTSNSMRGVFISTDYGKSWKRENTLGLGYFDTVAFTYTNSLSKIFKSNSSISLISNDLGKNWVSWRQSVIDTNSSNEQYLQILNLSGDGNRKICSPSMTSQALAYKSFSEKIVTSGSAEFVFVGAGNWLVKNIGSETPQ